MSERLDKILGHLKIHQNMGSNATSNGPKESITVSMRQMFVALPFPIDDKL